MKRNKPIKKASNPSERKRRYFYDERRAEPWAIAVESCIANGSRTFSMEGSEFVGEVGESRYFGSEVYRWNLHRGGVTIPVYGKLWEFDSVYHPRWFNGPIPEGTTFDVFSAKRSCSAGNKCPMTHYFNEDIDYTLTQHIPGKCPMGVSGEGSWKYTKTIITKPQK
ncbi:hypothetical protein [Rhodococcus qingshengii]|uniref:hypothetical protein n=1 Tax=Rhodococcus qingshengii TaxID=334542 RepID=UPI0035D58A18